MEADEPPALGPRHHRTELRLLAADVVRAGRNRAVGERQEAQGRGPGRSRRSHEILEPDDEDLLSWVPVDVWLETRAVGAVARVAVSTLFKRVEKRPRLSMPLDLVTV